jgi:two-component system phosphate regulon sensor histidine kinase PhoR
VTPIVLEGNIIGIVETFRDITKEKNIDKAKTEFVSLASHQLRTPLTSIRWALSSLKRDNLLKEQDYIVNGAHEAAVQMAATINKMLMISRIEMGGIEQKRSKIDMCMVIEKVARLFDGDRERHALELVVQCPRNLRAQTDEQLLIEILSNLLNNAYNYTPKGGRVTIRAAKEGEMIRIDVTDTGYGIPKAEQGSIAEKFFRASNIASREEAGTGIGLYMVYNIVRLIGGTISFVSEENKGTTFSLLFPS